MESRAKFLGHSIHQLLIVFPLGLLSAAVVFDGVHLATGSPTMAVVAYWMIVAGIVGGLVAAPFGLIDWLAVPSGTRAKAIGLAHAAANVGVLALFTTSAVLRMNEPGAPGVAALALSGCGFVLGFVGGWLGGELVSRLGVGVYDGAHLDSPNSLSNRPASDSVRATGR